MKNRLAITTLLFTLVSGCACLDEAHKPDAAIETAVETQPVNDFPTRDRVEYVLECVAKHGGLTYINQYACGCKVDKIAEKLSFADFEAAKTFGQMQKTAGEAGAVFRDAQQAKDLKTKLKEAEADAEKACFVK
jgi:hypothetical protein